MKTEYRFVYAIREYNHFDVIDKLKIKFSDHSVVSLFKKRVAFPRKLVSFASINNKTKLKMKVLYQD